MALKLEGLQGLQKQLKAVAAEARPKLMRSAMRAAFKPVLEDAQSRVPVDTGELRAGLIMASAKVKGQSALAVGIAVTSNSTALKQARMAAAAFNEGQSTSMPPQRRWHFIELGTAKRAAQPFLRPAMHVNQQTVIDSMSTELKKKIRKALKKKGQK